MKRIALLFLLALLSVPAHSQYSQDWWTRVVWMDSTNYNDVTADGVNRFTALFASGVDGVYIRKPDGTLIGPLGTGGGGGTPGGSTTEFQYNNGGVFGGTTYFKWNGTSVLATTPIYVWDNNATGARQEHLYLGNFADATTTPQYIFSTYDTTDQSLDVRSQRWQGGIFFRRQSATGWLNGFRLWAANSSASGFDFYDNQGDNWWRFRAPTSITTNWEVIMPAEMTDGNKVLAISASSSTGTATFADAVPVGVTAFGSGWNGASADSGITQQQIYDELTDPRVICARLIAEADVGTGTQLIMFIAERAYTITKIRAIGGTSVDVDIDPEITTAMGTAGSDIFSSPQTLTNSTTGASWSSGFNDTSVAAGEMIVMVFDRDGTSKWVLVEIVGYPTP